MFQRPSIIVLGLVLQTIAVSAYAQDAQLQLGFAETVQPFIQTYCVTCHGHDQPKGDFDLTAYPTAASVVKDQKQWDLVAQRLSNEEMPPEHAKLKPTAEQRAAIVAWIGAMSKSASQRNAGDPGPVLARRLSNAEYDYTIRDLTGQDIRPTKEFPVDPANEAGFDNSGESLAMSPALVKKYIDAARLVSEHIVFKPSGFTFAPSTMMSFEDRDNYAVHRVVDFYLKQKLDYADFFNAAWRFQNRAALGRADATLPDVAKDFGISPKYLATILDILSMPAQDVGPIAAIQARWKTLPAPADGKEPGAVREDCVKIRDFINELRPYVKHNFDNLPAPGIAAGSQTLVLWKDTQFAINRMDYPGNARQVDMSYYRTSDPAMLIPETDPAKAKYEESFKKFCAVFPDVFYVSERARAFLTNARDIASDLQGHRLLTAGFHSQMGYFRDDQPLYELVLDDSQKQELDTLWNELDYITVAPKRQFQQFIWFERGEPPSFMATSEFNSFRPEDDEVLTEKRINELGELYLAKAMQKNLSQTAQQVIKDYFVTINGRIRALEKVELASEPSHLDALVAFAERAYRRPLSKSEQDDLRGFYQSLRDKTGLSHEDAIRDAVVSVLMSPNFCYRVDAVAGGAGDVRPLSDYALASRLSYFLWSSMPDAELLSHAGAGDLHQPEVLLAQAQRMLKDDHIRDFATEFGGNWLDFRRFEEHNAVDRQRFPQFTNDLREAMFQEPLHFITDLVQNDKSVLNFLYADYTFVNPVLAQHYGMPELSSSSNDNWEKVDHADQYQRGGLLPMAVFLTKNAPGLRTSPVKRGYWVDLRLLGEKIPPPPPNVPALPSDESKLGDLTLRQTLERHRSDPTCAACHQHFDSMGLVFEGYGPIGETRTLDLGGKPVQTSADFPGGSEGSGLEGLKTYIREHRQNDFLDNLCRKMVVYALGRSLLPSDDSLVQEMRQKLVDNGYRFGTMVDSIVTSEQFLEKRNDLISTR